MHTKLKLPGGDLLIHAGDMTSRGSTHDISRFLTWMEKQPYTHKILIPGNHDFGFETDFALWKDECEKKGIHLLNDSGIEIQGIRIWGSPITPWFHSWAFNRYRGREISKHWDLIPEETEILITHGPPEGILDLVPRDGSHVGCADLLDKILRTKVKLHIFGHIHEGRGFTYKHARTFINASSLDGSYQPVSSAPIVIIQDEDEAYVVEE